MFLRAFLAAVAPHNSGFQTFTFPGSPRVCALSIRTSGMAWGSRPKCFFLQAFKPYDWHANAWTGVVGSHE